MLQETSPSPDYSSMGSHSRRQSLNGGSVLELRPTLSGSSGLHDDFAASAKKNTNRKSRALRRRRWRVGLILLGLVVLLWVASGFLVNSIFSTGEYPKPYFLTYMNTAVFSVYLVPTVFRKVRGTDKKDTPEYSVVEEEEQNSDESPKLTPFKSVEQLTGQDEDELLSTKQTAILSLQFCILWFFSNFLTNASLKYTSVSSQTILSCTSSFFTLVIGSVFGVEAFTATKLLALVFSMCGVFLVSKADSVATQTSVGVQTSDIVFGDLLALAGAVVYGFYMTLLKVKVGDESRINTKMFLGFVGLFNILLLWPTIPLLDYLGVEKFGLPQTEKVWLIVLANAAATLVSDFFWVLAMLMTSPLVVTVGLGATVPLAMAGDLFIKRSLPSLTYVFGAVILCLSFVVINRQDEDESMDDDE
ncbi:putative vacuolar membrane protein [Yarrowia sp. C11]|nr:putative vacuolar membrane protein [Yarrowia sp. C11]KAG5370554.1 putative vacuolar membrane protein [Yarrowia sp. E02]